MWIAASLIGSTSRPKGGTSSACARTVAPSRVTANTSDRTSRIGSTYHELRRLDMHARRSSVPAPRASAHGCGAKGTTMIELFTHGSPNGHKVTIALEELALPYEVRPVNVFAGEGQRPEFLALNPAGKIPVIRDLDNGAVVTESAAILLYLADKAGRLVPASSLQRVRALELLFLQASLQGPMFGQRSHFSLFGPETVPYAIRRYEQQAEIIDALVDKLLT